MQLTQLALWCGLLLCGGMPVLAAEQRPNIIILLTDDQGYPDIGLHGAPHLKTPNLDRFAREGIELSRFYVSPVCAPTRAGLMTGRYYYRTGVIHTSKGGAKMHGDEVTLAESLSGAGYRTGIFGKWHLGDNYPMRPRDQGFQEALVLKSGGIVQTPDLPNSYFDPILWHNGERVQPKGYCTDIFFNAALRFIEQNREQPFFVYLPTNAPHAPLEVDPALVKTYLDAGLNDTTARVYAMIENIDDNVGRLLSRLDDWKLRENTLIVFFGDNGSQQPRYNAGLNGRKGSVYEGGIRAPFFLQWPKRLRGGWKSDTIAANIDLTPTILDFCGVQLPRDRTIDGRSLRPMFEFPAQNWPDRMLFAQCHRGLTPHPYHNAAVVTQRYKLLSTPQSFGKEEWTPPKTPAWELFDLAADPGESRNIAAAHPDIVAKLGKAYDEWFESVRAERNFLPGWIVIGNSAEPKSHLCRNQDAQHIGPIPQGWPVRIERGGRYRVTINRGDPKDPSELCARWQDREQVQPLKSGETAAVFELSAGEGLLDIYFRQPGQPRVPITENSILGDVDVERLE